MHTKHIVHAALCSMMHAEIHDFSFHETSIQSSILYKVLSTSILLLTQFKLHQRFASLSGIMEQNAVMTDSQDSECNLSLLMFNVIQWL